MSKIKPFLFTPESIEFPEDLLSLESRSVTETDTLMETQRYVTSFERFTCISFNLEGDVASEYIFLDGHLVMLEHSIFGDAHFWIGKGKLLHEMKQKILLTDG